MHENTKYRLSCLAQIPLKYLAAATAMRVARVFKAGEGRFTWSITDVGNSVFPDADLRNYYDGRNIREIIAGQLQGRRVRRACELGCGYGRVTPILKEFADETIGLERERHLRELGNHYLNDIVIHPIEDLTDVGKHGPFDLIMICTVLQHITTDHAQRVMTAMKTAVAPGGYILIVESTHGSQAVVGDPTRGDQFLSQPRAATFYVEQMKPWHLVSERPRCMEKSFIGDPGTLMLFQRD